MIKVGLYRSGNYWAARWRDTAGRQHGKGLGSIKKVSPRAARVRATWLENELNSGHAEPAEPRTLRQHIDAFLESRTDLAEATRSLYRLTGRYLIGHFGEHKAIDKITREEARAWRTALALGELAHVNKQNKGTPGESTVCRLTKEAKTLFKQAVDDELIPSNPFDKLNSSPPRPDKNWYFVELPELRRLLDACPNDSWRLLLALCRLAGLRRGEAMRLKWSAVDQNRKRIVVNDEISHQDTKHRRREVPIVAELQKMLFASYMGDELDQRVVTDIRGSFHRGFEAVAKRAKVVMYARPFHTLRKNCETEWLRQYDVFTVCEWLGHSATVSKEHYHKAKDESYEHASAVPPPEFVSKSVSKTDNDRSQIAPNSLP